MTLGGQYSDRLIDLSQILMTDFVLCFYNTLKKEDAPIFAHPPICKYIKFQKSH